MNAVDKILQSPLTALIVTLVLAAAALSGQLSVIAARCLLVATFAATIIGLRAQPWPVLIGGSTFVAGGLILLGYWFRPDVIPAYSGVLSPQATLLFSPDGGKITKIQIGQSRVFIIDPDNPLAAQLFPALRTTEFKVENIGGEVKVSAQMLDREGHLIEDRVQLQGLWWIDLGPPNGIRQLTVRENPEGGGAEFTITPEDVDPPPIIPMFEYPSEHHLGELRKARKALR